MHFLPISYSSIIYYTLLNIISPTDRIYNKYGAIELKTSGIYDVLENVSTTTA